MNPRTFLEFRRAIAFPTCCIMVATPSTWALSSLSSRPLLYSSFRGIENGRSSSPTVDLFSAMFSFGALLFFFNTRVTVLYGFPLIFPSIFSTRLLSFPGFFLGCEDTNRQGLIDYFMRFFVGVKLLRASSWIFVLKTFLLTFIASVLSIAMLSFHQSLSTFSFCHSPLEVFPEALRV